MPKLNDTQSILLSTASQREDGNVLPVADSIADQQDRIATALTDLLKHKLVDEPVGAAKPAAWREEGNDRLALIINDEGRAAIGVGDGAPEPATGEDKGPAVTQPRATSKSAAVIALLQREQGAALPELIEATGWLPHTTRAALTGLRKKGHVIEKTKRDDATCYRIATVA